MYTTRLREYAHTTSPISPSIVNKCLHHDSMSAQQVVLFKSIEMLKLFVCGNSVFHLLYLSQWGNNGLAIHNVSYLVFVKGITLNGKRTMNGFYLIGLAQQQRVFLLHTNGISLYKSRDIGNLVDGFC